MSGCRVNRVFLSGPTLSQQRAGGAISLQGHDISCPYRRLGVHESRQDIIRLARLTRKPRLHPLTRLWTPRPNCAIIPLWNPGAHNAEPRCTARRKAAAGARNCRMSRCRPATKGACAAIVCWPRSKRCRNPAKGRKRKASIDLNRGDASRPGHFRQARDYSARDVVEALRTFGVYTEGGDGLPGVSSDTNARTDLN